jgi:hypothetical protein
MVKGMMMEKTIITKITRKKGYMYYVDGEGNVCETPLNRKGTPKGTLHKKTIKKQKKNAKEQEKKLRKDPSAFADDNIAIRI